jgi:hypothetical protein
VRPHSSLGYLTRLQFKQKQSAKQQPARGQVPRN